MLLVLAIFQNLLLFPCIGLARCKRSRRFRACRGESGLVSVMMHFARHSAQYCTLPKGDRFLRSVEGLWPNRPTLFACTYREYGDYQTCDAAAKLCFKRLDTGGGRLVD